MGHEVPKKHQRRKGLYPFKATSKGSKSRKRRYMKELRKIQINMRLRKIQEENVENVLCEVRNAQAPVRGQLRGRQEFEFQSNETKDSEIRDDDSVDYVTVERIKVVPSKRPSKKNKGNKDLTHIHQEEFNSILLASQESHCDTARLAPIFPDSDTCSGHSVEETAKNIMKGKTCVEIHETTRRSNLTVKPTDSKKVKCIF